MDVPKLRISSMWTRCNSTIFLLLLSCPLILIFLSACSKGPSEEDCPRYTVMTEKGVEVKLEPGAEAKFTGVRGFVTGAIGYTEEKKLADTDRVLLRLDAYQHRYCVLAFKAGQNAKKAKTEEERQKYLAEQEKMQKKSLEAFEDLRTLALKYDEVMKGKTTTAEFTGAVNELKAEIAKLGEEIKEDKVLQKEFKKIDEKVAKRILKKDIEPLPTQSVVPGVGYVSVKLLGMAETSSAQVLVNGRKISGFALETEILLDPLLKRGEVSIITFVFKDPMDYQYSSKDDRWVRMFGKVGGSDDWLEFYSFTPSKGQLEDSVEVFIP